jgi:hypothetical protein
MTGGVRACCPSHCRDDGSTPVLPRKIKHAIDPTPNCLRNKNISKTPLYRSLSTFTADNASNSSSEGCDQRSSACQWVCGCNWQYAADPAESTFSTDRMQHLRKSWYAHQIQYVDLVEFMNPGGSVKDRAALYVVKDAEEKGNFVLSGGPVLTMQA